MSALAAEWIKLGSTRSTRWLLVATVVVGVVITATAIANNASDDAPASIWQSQFGVSFALPLLMMTAALTVTSEYRSGLIHVTFLAMPDRWRALVAKSLVVAGLASVVGLITAFASWAAARAVRPADDLALVTGQQWRNVVGASALFAISAVLAVGVALLVRHTAGTVAVMIAYPLVGELLLSGILGENVSRWLPLNVGRRFLTAGLSGPDVAEAGPGIGSPSSSDLSPGIALGYYALVAIAVLGVGVAVTRRRDA